jgi:DNA-binding response OmpR family regulator
MAKTVLIVEDDKEQGQVLFDTIKNAGYEVILSTSGQDGLKIALDKQPDLIILDNRMPEMSGFSMLRKLRAESSWGQRVPVLFFSNVQIGDDLEAEDIENAGAVDYLIKSDTTLEHLIAKIRSILAS